MIISAALWNCMTFFMSSYLVSYLIYSLSKETFFLVCGIVAVSVGILGMLVFGCGIYHGNKNLRLVIEDFKEKVSKTE